MVTPVALLSSVGQRKSEFALSPGVSVTSEETLKWSFFNLALFRVFFPAWVSSRNFSLKPS